MPQGIPIDRQWLCVLDNGNIILDWGDGTGVDLATNQVIHFNEAAVAHAVSDEDLELLRRMERIISFDIMRVYIRSLPERGG